MADGLFGAPVGLRAYQDDQNKLAQLALQSKQVDAQARLAEAQMANFAADNKRADDAAKLAAEQRADEQRLQQELAKIAQGESGGTSGAGLPALAGGSRFDSLLATGEKQVRHLMNLGRVKEATDLAAKLTNGVKDLEQARQAASAAKENEFDVLAKKHQQVSQFLSGATNQASYEAAKLQLVANGVLTPEDVAEMPRKFNPLFIQSAIAGTAAAKQKADLAREASRTAAANANDYSQIKHRDLTRELDKKRLELQEQREARLEKQGEARLASVTGKKPQGAPVAREIAAVSAELKRMGRSFSSDVAPALKNDLVEEVRDRVRGTGLSWGEATAAVVSEMEADGRITESTFGKDKYKPEGKTKERPLALPATREALVPGNFYRDPKTGRVEQFNGFGKK